MLECGAFSFKSKSGSQRSSKIEASYSFAVFCCVSAVYKQSQHYVTNVSLRYYHWGLVYTVFALFKFVLSVFVSVLTAHEHQLKNASNKVCVSNYCCLLEMSRLVDSFNTLVKSDKAKSLALR